jgi:hypothetical protein
MKNKKINLYIVFSLLLASLALAGSFNGSIVSNGSSGNISGDFNAAEHCNNVSNRTDCQINFSSSGVIYLEDNVSGKNISDIILNITVVKKSVSENETTTETAILLTTGNNISSQPGSPFGITLTPVSDISNMVMLSTTEVVYSAQKNPFGYIFFVSAVALLIIILLRNRKDKKYESQQVPIVYVSEDETGK